MAAEGARVGDGAARGASGTGFEGWEGEHDEGARTVGVLSHQQMFDLVDKVMFRGEVAAGDKRPIGERFASAAVGKGAGTQSGFKSLAQKRKAKQVVNDYSTVQGYRCSNCRRFSVHDLAVRPPGYLEIVLRPGPNVQSYPPGMGPDDDYVVYEQDHKEQLERAGFKLVKMHFFKPGLPLPAGFVPADVGGPSPGRSKAKRVAPTVAVMQPQAPDSAAEACNEDQAQGLKIPQGVPEWKSQQELFNMVEKNFVLKAEDGNQLGPFTAVYRWPTKRQHLGPAWKERRSKDNLGYLYQDYYFLRVKSQDTLLRVQTKFPQLFEKCTPGTSPLDKEPFPTVKSVWRNDTVPKGHTWRGLVVDYLRGTLGNDFQEPFSQ